MAELKKITDKAEIIDRHSGLILEALGRLVERFEENAAEFDRIAHDGEHGLITPDAAEGMALNQRQRAAEVRRVITAIGSVADDQ
ncbi:hypothetical protein ACN20G_23375 [Streptomyces sp. BI20]|uniref:hypothetical protein n=1 Tax=Streptomyces sp. BI20 TaxID=3403460 RepID=UPI003C75BD74